MPQSDDLRQAWDRLPAPDAEQGFRTIQVAATNAWLYKRADGGAGLLLVGVKPPTRLTAFRHIHLEYLPEKYLIVGSKTHELRRCLQLDLDASCDGTTLMRILQRLEEDQTGDGFTTALLERTMEDVVNLVRRTSPEPPFEEILGAWGELHLLHMLLLRTTDSQSQVRVLEGWESEGEGRDIIDFRFPGPGMAVEVKTSQGQRVHRFHGHRQVHVPAGYDAGFVASVVAHRDRAGRSCVQLVDDIRATARGGPAEQETFDKVLDQRLALRGAACASDEDRLSCPPAGLRLYRMADVPSPSESPEIRDVEWTAALDTAPSLTAEEADSVIGAIVTQS